MEIKKAEQKAMRIKKAREQSIKVKSQSIKVASATGAKLATDQMDGGEEMQNAALTFYIMSRPALHVTKQGARFARDSMRKTHEKQLKRKEQHAGKKEQNKNDGKDKKQDKGKKKSSNKGDSDKGEGKKKKRGIRGLIHKLQMMAYVKQSKAEDGEGKNNRWEMLLVQKIAIPALAFMVLGLLLVALVAIPILLVVALIYNSPFAIFFPPLEHGDTVQSVTSAYVAEFNREVYELADTHSEHDVGKVIYVGFEESDVIPTNMNDILAVYMVKHGTGNTATVIKDTTKRWIATVVDDMCDYTTSSGIEAVQNEDGTESSRSVLFVHVTLKDYQDMISIYGFSDNEVKLIESMMKVWEEGD